MVGSCNGLICFGRNDEDILGAVPFLICNPLTGESIFVPEYNYSELPRDLQIPKNPRLLYGSLAGGFGYCSSSKKYKVVTIYYHPRDHKGHVQIYTVGGEWRYIGLIDGYKIDYCSGIYANGELYWLLKSNHLVPNYTIVAFNMEGEKFRRISLPHYKDFKLLGGNNKLYLVDKIRTMNLLALIYWYTKDILSTMELITR
ncbi:hypothetical protein MKX03_025751 [Papaver bracteatum]|nr:hypothetical protein MKX03_025751 [Papaver bracteatum]